MSAHVGDRIIVEAKTASTTARAGVIEEILSEETPRYAVRWDDGRTTIFSPAAGSARVEPVKARRRSRGNGGTSARGSTTRTRG